jgi:hypothetical protein
VRYEPGWSPTSFDDSNITHTPNNGSWHQLRSGLDGEATISFSGQCPLAHVEIIVLIRDGRNGCDGLRFLLVI